MPDIGVSKDALRAVVGLSGEFVGTTDSATLTTKTINTTDNTLTATSQAAGDILVNNATKFVRRAIGAAEKPLKVNSGATDLEYATLKVAGGGTGVATLTGIVKASGTSNMTAVAAPTGAIVGDTDTQTLTLKTIDMTANVIKNEASQETIFCYKDSVTSQYKARNTKTGAIVATSADPDGPIASAVSTGTVRFSSDDFIFSAGFAGVTIPANTSIFCTDSTFFTVPQGYTGYVFKMGSGNPNHWHGGQFREGGTPAALWTAFKLESSSATGVNTTIENCKITNCGTGILLLVSHASGFVNSCYFNDIQIFNPVIGVDFQNTGVTWAGQIGPIGQNVFDSVFIQCSARTTHGFKNIQNSDNVFVGCKTWDSQLGNSGAGCFRSTFHATDNIAGSHLVLGGIMTGTIGTHYTDTLGSACIIDQFTGFKPNKSINATIDLQNNVYQIKCTNAILKQGGTSQWYIRNAADSAYGNLRLENLQFFSMTNQAGTTAFCTNDGTVISWLQGIKHDAYVDLKAITIPSDPASTYVRVYPKAADANTDSLYVKAKLQGAVAEMNFFP